MADKMVGIGSLVRIKDDATGSGSMARGKEARVVEWTTGSYGLVAMVFVELVDGPTPEMKDIPGKPWLDLYPEEYEVLEDEPSRQAS
jgi:hypothetical protein